MSYRRAGKESDELLYTSRSLVIVSNQLQVVNVGVIFLKQIEINSQKLLSSTVEIATR